MAPGDPVSEDHMRFLGWNLVGHKQGKSGFSGLLAQETDFVLGKIRDAEG